MKFTNEQIKFIEKNFKQTSNDKLIANISKLKNFIPTNIADGYKELNEEDTIASVWNVQVNVSNERNYTCVCGRRIKYQYLLTHKVKDIELSLGSGHYKEYCGISIAKVNKIIASQNVYNKRVEELQELMNKGEINRQEYLLDMVELPERLRSQLRIGLPLIQQQMNQINNIINPNVTKMINKFSSRDMTEFNLMPPDERKGLLLMLKNGSVISSLEELKNIKYNDIRDLNTVRIGEDTEECNSIIMSEELSASEKAIEKARNKMLALDELISANHIDDNKLDSDENLDISSLKMKGIRILQNLLASKDRKSILKKANYGGSTWWYLYDETEGIRIEYIDRRYDVVELRRRINAISNSRLKEEWIIDKGLFDNDNSRNDMKRHMKEISHIYPEVLVLDCDKSRVVKRKFA